MSDTLTLIAAAAIAASGLVSVLVWRSAQARVRHQALRLIESEQLRQDLLRQVNQLRQQLDEAGKVIAAIPARAAAARRRDVVAMLDAAPTASTTQSWRTQPTTWQDTQPAPDLADPRQFASTRPDRL